MKVTLSAWQIHLGAVSGAATNIRALFNGQTMMYQGSDNNGWRNNVVGTCGEIAVASALNLFWHGGVGRKKMSDVGNDIQVRTRLDKKYDLIVRENDGPEYVYFLVLAHDMPTFDVVGWIKGSDAKQAKWFTDPTHKDQPAFFVPQAALRPSEEYVRA